MGFRAIAFGTVFAFCDSFPFPNPIQTREAETGNSPFHVSDEAETKPWPSIILQTVPSIIETTLTSPGSGGDDVGDQKKTSELLGIPLNPLERDETD